RVDCQANTAASGRPAKILAGNLVAPTDGELLDPAAQRARLQAQGLRGTRRTFDPPVRPAQDLDDVPALDLDERIVARRRGTFTHGGCRRVSGSSIPGAW